MKFLLVIPVYNEEKIIERTLDKVLNEFLSTPASEVWNVEILVVDNGSTDNTYSITNEYILKKKHIRSNASPAVNLRVIKISEKGKGLAILTGAKEAEREAEKVGSGFDFFGFIDADLSIHPKFIVNFLSEISQNKILKDGIISPENNIDILVGSRLLDKNIVNRGFLRSLSSQIFSFFAHKILKIKKVRDTQCGLKIMNIKGLNEILKCSEKGWFLDLEFLARAEQAGLYIVEKPVSWNEFEYKDRVPKLKIIRDSLIGIMAILKIRNRLKSP